MKDFSHLLHVTITASYVAPLLILFTVQAGLKKVLSNRPKQADFPATREVTFCSYLPLGKGQGKSSTN